MVKDLINLFLMNRQIEVIQVVVSPEVSKLNHLVMNKSLSLDP